MAELLDHHRSAIRYATVRGLSRSAEGADKQRISVAESGRLRVVEYLGEIANALQAPSLARATASGKSPAFCYEQRTGHHS